MDPSAWQSDVAGDEGSSEGSFGLVELLHLAGSPIPFVRVNSMAFEGDERQGCLLCASAQEQLARVHALLDCWNARHRAAWHLDDPVGSVGGPVGPLDPVGPVGHTPHAGDIEDGLGGAEPDLELSARYRFYNTSIPSTRPTSGSPLGAQCGLVKGVGLRALEMRPILLLHMPLYRHSDGANCSDIEMPPAIGASGTSWASGKKGEKGRRAQRSLGVDEMPAPERWTRCREKWDCMSQAATQQILRTLKPRLVLTGHTHFSCRVQHTLPVWVQPLPLPAHS